MCKTVLVSIALVLVALASHSLAFAQEGFPLDGTWRGAWGAAGQGGTTVVIVLSWDGTNINGVIDPGPDSLRISKAVLDPSSWSVHIEAASEAGMPIVIDSVLDKLGSYNRELNGTWTADGVTYPFHAVRQ